MANPVDYLPDQVCRIGSFDAGSLYRAQYESGRKLIDKNTEKPPRTMELGGFCFYKFRRIIQTLHQIYIRFRLYVYHFIVDTFE